MMKAYINTDQHLHVLCQLIAKVNKLMVPEQEDDSHTNLFFDTISKRMLGRWFKDEQGRRFIMSLHLSSLKLECLDKYYKPMVSIKSEQKTIAEIEALLSKKLINKKIITTALPANMHYDIPDYHFAQEKLSRPRSKDIMTWRRYREMANVACASLLGHLAVVEEVRTWPHHFDTGIYVEPTEEFGIGFGLAMADSIINEPYFYFSAYALKGNISYDNLPPLRKGQWEIGDGFKGAILPLSQIQGRRLKKAKQILNQFMKDALLITRQ